MTKIPLMFIVLFTAMGCNEQKKEELSYHPDGQIMHKFAVVNGKREGKGISFYPDGKIYSECEWHNGKLEGKCVFYSPSGLVSSLTNWKDSVMTGESLSYWANGKMRQRAILDSLGRIVDYDKYDSLGLRLQRKSALFTSDGDTLKLGDDYVALVRLGNRQFNRMEVILGDPNDLHIYSKPPLPKKDSLTAILRVKASHLGKNTVQGIVIEMNSGIDSASTVPFVHHFFVVNE